MGKSDEEWVTNQQSAPDATENAKFTTPGQEAYETAQRAVERVSCGGSQKHPLSVRVILT